jgi:hypothetical protein
MAPEEALRNILKLVEGPDEVEDAHAVQILLQSLKTLAERGFWSIFKRGIVGSFHKVGAKCLPLYVAEFQFRYNPARVSGPLTSTGAASPSLDRSVGCWA